MRKTKLRRCQITIYFFSQKRGNGCGCVRGCGRFHAGRVATQSLRGCPSCQQQRDIAASGPPRLRFHALRVDVPGAARIRGFPSHSSASSAASAAVAEGNCLDVGGGGVDAVFGLLPVVAPPAGVPCVPVGGGRRSGAVADGRAAAQPPGAAAKLLEAAADERRARSAVIHHARADCCLRFR